MCTQLARRPAITVTLINLGAWQYRRTCVFGIPNLYQTLLLRILRTCESTCIAVGQRPVKEWYCTEDRGIVNVDREFSEAVRPSLPLNLDLIWLDRVDRKRKLISLRMFRARDRTREEPNSFTGLRGWHAEAFRRL